MNHIALLCRVLQLATAICLLLLLCGCPRKRAQPSPTSAIAPSLSLQVRLDRETYFEHEPIYVDWVLKNETDEPIRLFDFAYKATCPIVFECTKDEGYKRQLKGDWTCGDFFGTPPIYTIEPHCYLAGTFPLHHYFRGLHGRGTFRLFPSCWLVTRVEDDQDLHETFTADPVSFTVTGPDSANQDGLALINAEYELVDRGPDLPRDDIINGEWVYTCLDLYDKLQSAGPRYRLALDFVHVLRYAPSDLEFSDDVFARLRESSARWRPKLEAIQSNPDASKLMAGFAACYLVRCDFFEGKAKMAELNTRAQALEKEYGESYIGFEARKLREYMEVNGKYDPPKTSK